MEFKNNVTRFLDSKRVSYQAFTYSYDAGIQSAVEVATAIGLPAEQVYKTLVTVADDAKRKPMLVVVPGPATLDLRLFAPPTRRRSKWPPTIRLKASPAYKPAASVPWP